MADRPVAEVAVTVSLVRRLLRDQHPDLADLELEEVSEGWDNSMLRLGPDLAVRVPRREQAAQLVLNEQRWLPQLAGYSTIAVPVPVRVGRPTTYFPWAWSIVPWFEGIEVGAVPIAQRTQLAIDLARCVVGLHQPAPPDAPTNPYRGVPLADRAQGVDERLAHPGIARAAEARQVWADALSAPAWQGPPLWVHGDLHPFNMLARPAHASTDVTVCALLDFGEIGRAHV